jgi:hypothetical protein
MDRGKDRDGEIKTGTEIETGGNDSDRDREIDIHR